MKSFLKYALLFIMMYSGAAQGQDTISISLKMNGDTINDLVDLKFKATITSTYKEKITVASSELDGIIWDTTVYLYYELQKKKGNEFEIITPYKTNYHLFEIRGLLGKGDYFPRDTLIRFKPIILEDDPSYYHIYHGEYRFRIQYQVLIQNNPRLFFSNWCYFYCPKHFAL